MGLTREEEGQLRVIRILLTWFHAALLGCYICIDTWLAFKAIDVNAEGHMDWNEFLVYIKWALHKYP